MLQKCLYSLTSVSGNVITGTHTTPVARSVSLNDVFFLKSYEYLRKSENLR
jgi:hypothetical protein